jgi:Fic family protein
MPPVPYHTGRFPPADLDWPRLISLIGPASAAVARYDGMLAAVPNPDVLLSPLTTQEAVLSSRIEGTQATMGEVLEFEAGQEAASPERGEDIHEVLNYRAAMREAERLLAKLPISQRVIRGMHGVLLAGVRGQNKSPGEYRRIPNWIGPPGCTPESARFLPIAADKLPDAMSAWERYAHDDAPDRLAQLAILHAEFEALHPFLDGNGRLGRMLVPRSHRFSTSPRDGRCFERIAWQHQDLSLSFCGKVSDKEAIGSPVSDNPRAPRRRALRPSRRALARRGAGGEVERRQAR